VCADVHACVRCASEYGCISGFTYILPLLSPLVIRRLISMPSSRAEFPFHPY